jgi:hypothetical protein
MFSITPVVVDLIMLFFIKDDEAGNSTTSFKGFIVTSVNVTGVIISVVYSDATSPVLHPIVTAIKPAKRLIAVLLIFIDSIV